MTIYGLHYFNNTGEVGYFDTPDDPYFLGPTHSKLGLSLFNSNIGIGWYFFRKQYDDGDVKIIFDRTCRAIYDASRTRIIVVGEKKPLIAWPKNASVFNEDGTLDHVIDLPPQIEHSFDGKKIERFAPEGFSYVEYHNGAVALGIHFCFQWIQTRLYDPFTREWGKVIAVGRN